MSIDIGAGRVIRRSGAQAAWTARRRWPPSGRASRGPSDRVPRSAGGGAPPPHRRPTTTVSDTSPTGLSDAAKGVKPAYPPWPHSVRPRRRLAGGRAPSDPTSPTARHEPRTRRVGEDSRQRGGACRVARQGRAARLTLSDLARAGRPQNGGRLARYSAPGGGGSRGPRSWPRAARRWLVNGL